MTPPQRHRDIQHCDIQHFASHKNNVVDSVTFSIVTFSTLYLFQCFYVHHFHNEGSFSHCLFSVILVCSCLNLVCNAALEFCIMVNPHATLTKELEIIDSQYLALLHDSASATTMACSTDHLVDEGGVVDLSMQDFKLMDEATVATKRKWIPFLEGVKRSRRLSRAVTLPASPGQLRFRAACCANVARAAVDRRVDVQSQSLFDENTCSSQSPSPRW